MVPNATVKLGNFGVDLGLQQLYRDNAPSGRLRIFATVRGDPSITWIDFDEAAGQVDCGSSGTYTRCSPEHRLTRLRSDCALAKEALSVAPAVWPTWTRWCSRSRPSRSTSTWTATARACSPRTSPPGR